MAGFVLADAVSNVPTYTGKAWRLLTSALGSKSTTRPLGGRSGVTAGTPSSILAVTASQWTVQPFTGFLDVSAASDGGTPFAFDSAVTGAVNAPDSSQPRADLLFIRHDDPAESAGPANATPVIGYLAGLANGAQALPATPARSIPFAQINVPKLNNGAPTITLIAPYTVAAGGILPVPNDPTQYPTAPYLGQYIDDAALGQMRWDGTAWQRYGKGGLTDWTAPTAIGTGITASTTVPPGVIREGRGVIVRGIITATFVNNNTPTGAVITLPVGFRPGTPVVRNGLAATNSVNAFVRGTVNPDGTVIIQNGSAGPAATGIDLSALSGYIAEN